MAGQMVSFPSNGQSAEGYLALPRTGKGPGVIVIQEWWGLVPHIKDVVERFAAQGFIALAPDLYHGKTTKEPDEAGKMMMALKMDEAARDMAGAFDFLKGHDACTGKIGSVGYCMGGALSLRLATVRPVDACVTYYGLGEIDVSKISAPVLGHFAEHDDWASPEAAHAFELKLRDAGKHAQFYMYTGTEHAFFNDSRPEVYNEAAANLSWDRTIAFFNAHLK